MLVSSSVLTNVIWFVTKMETTRQRQRGLNLGRRLPERAPLNCKGGEQREKVHMEHWERPSYSF